VFVNALNMHFNNYDYQYDRFCTLLPGDLILTGTPPGVGAFAKPPQFLKVSLKKVGGLSYLTGDLFK
jgi:Fumarylacetoacetate (FAA) hydrolase family